MRHAGFWILILKLEQSFGLWNGLFHISEIVHFLAPHYDQQARWAVWACLGASAQYA